MKVLIEKHEPYTLQQAFNKAWEWANTHERCLSPRIGNSSQQCLYRSPDNTNACLIGAMISDEEIGPIAERAYSLKEILKIGQPFVDLVQKSFAFSLKEEYNVDTLEILQACHDRAKNSEDVLVKLTEFAKNNNLEIPNS